MKCVNATDTGRAVQMTNSGRTQNTDAHPANIQDKNVNHHSSETDGSLADDTETQKSP